MLCPSASSVPSMRACWSLQGALPLHFGGQLEHVRVAWRLVGDPAAPVVAAFGGISAGDAVTDYGGDKGWWSDIIGPGRALDSNRYRILGIDFSVAAVAAPVRVPAKTISDRSPLKTRRSPASCDRPSEAWAVGGHRRRVLWRHGRVGVRRALAATRQTHRRDQCRPSLAPDGDGLAQRATSGRSLRGAKRRGCRRLATCTSAGDGDLSQPGRIRAAFRRPRRARRRTFPVSRSSPICWLVAMRTPPPIFPKLSCACRSPSICTGWKPSTFACRPRWLPSLKTNSCRWPICGR